MESPQAIAAPTAAGPAGATARLSVMMFLQFFIWGAWYVTTSTFMTEAGMATKIGIAYTLCPLAALISPFFLGMVADRFFASERVLGVLHILGGVAMFFVPSAAQVGATPFLLIILAHALFYMPTLGLTNTIAFANMTNPEKQFPLVRVFGTLGWIVAGMLISFMGVDKTATPYTLAGGAAVALGLFSFMLPHTPPPAKGKQATIGEVLGVGALSLFRSPSFVVFALASFLICIPLAAYYAYAGRLVADLGKPVGGTMSIGQWAEVVFMLLMPLFFARLGVKWMLAVGMLAWVARYALFAVGAPSSVYWMIVLGIALHGLCYDFFFVTGFIYTDKKAPKEIRGQAQGLLVLITQGLGLGLGAFLTGEMFNRIVGGATGAAALSAYPKFWWICAGLALIVLIAFVALFRDDSNDAPAEPRGFEVGSSESESGTAHS
ncbi:MAG: MFS transporter [Tepidisphaeraceae bacterium]